MKTTMITAAMITLLAGAGHAQSAVRAENSSRASASAASGRIAGDDAMRQTVEMGLPAGQVESVIAEGQARGVTAAEIDRAALAAHTRLRASRQALRDESRPAPTNAEIEAGATALASGADVSALAAIRRSAPANRSLTVSLQTLANLTSQGAASSAAAADVTAMLAAGATDSQLAAASAASVQGGASLPRPAVDATLDGAASVGLGGATGAANVGAGIVGGATVGGGIVGGL